MTEVYDRDCPGCQRLLTIPADWAGELSVQVLWLLDASRPKGRGAPRPSPPACRQRFRWPRQHRRGNRSSQWPLPEYMPPVATAPCRLRRRLLGPIFQLRLGIRYQFRYKGRGTYSGGPRIASWLKSIVIGAYWSSRLVAWAIACAAFKPGFSRSKSERYPATRRQRRRPSAPARLPPNP